MEVIDFFPYLWIFEDHIFEFEPFEEDGSVLMAAESSCWRTALLCGALVPAGRLDLRTRPVSQWGLSLL